MHIKFRHLVIFLLFFISCSKTSPIEEKKAILAGSSGGHKTWQLSSLTIGGQVQTLGPSELSYAKTYFYNSNYSDTDSYEGEWRLNSETELLEVYNNLPNGLMFQKYTIVEVTSNSLTLSYLINGEHVTTQFTSVK
jgi:hypothetical protein